MYNVFYIYYSDISFGNLIMKLEETFLVIFRF